jgi:hypothetical protein
MGSVNAARCIELYRAVQSYTELYGAIQSYTELYRLEARSVLRAKSGSEPQTAPVRQSVRCAHLTSV